MQIPLPSKFRCGAAAATLVVALSAPGFAEEYTVPGPEVSKRVEKVMATYEWSDSVSELRERAAEKKKLIFWLQIVGELDGGL